VLEGYGMTETVQAVFCNRADSTHRQAGHYPVPKEMEVKIRIPDAESFRLTDQPDRTGEICIRGPCVISGYLDDSDANREAFHDGYFRTGDLGTLHGYGRLQVTGRIKEMINKGGEKISPLDIEKIILAHEAIQQVACFKVPDETYGEDIGVAVMLKPEHNLGALDIKRFVRQESVNFKVPKIVAFVDSIPTNRSGKYMRSSLAERFGTVAVPRTMATT